MASRQGYAAPRGCGSHGAPRRKLSWHGVVVVLLTLATAGACSPTRENRPNIVVVVLDTFRADRLGPRPDRGSLTPFLDRFAAGARYWPAATSTAALTMPAMASVMTGRHPDRAGVVGHGPDDRLGSTVPTLALLATAAGYRTVATVTNPWLARRATGFARGYRSFTSGRTLGMAGARLPAAVVTDTALAAVDAEAPGNAYSLLLWVHYMDTHMPYPPVPSEAEDTQPASTTSRIVSDFSAHKADRQRIHFEAPYDAAEIEATRALYDAAAARVDGEVGRLLDGLGRRGLLDDAVVVVLSDHGEALGEHGLFFAHDFNVYDELVRVVLLIAAPGLAPGVDRGVVSLVDVLPTICSLAALDCPDDLDGADLSAPGRKPRIVFAASAPRRQRYDRAPWLTIDGAEGRMTTVRQRALKLIRTPRTGGPLWEAYDLENDPGETDDVHEPGEHAELRASLEVWLDRMTAARAASPSGSAASPPGRRMRRELRSLGYLN